MLEKCDMRVAPDSDTVKLFSGLLKCGHCGQNMCFRKVRRLKKDHCYYICTTKKNGEGCDYHSINAEKLEETVREILQKQVEIALDFDKLGRVMDHKPLNAHRLKLLDNQLDALQKEKERYQEMKERLYEDFTAEIIDEDDYQELKARFEDKIEITEQAQYEVREKKSNILNEPILPPDWISEIRQYGHVEKLTRKMVVMLIDEILVYSKNEIEIKFHYGDEIAAIASFVGRKPIEQKGVIA
jgi:hypothetical protein